MQKTVLLISSLLILLGCVQLRDKESIKKDTLSFKALISPAFDESAEVTILKTDSDKRIQFLLREANGDDKPVDTFYFKTVALTESQFRKIDSELLQKITIGLSIQNKRIRDGIQFCFTVVHNSDTSSLSFDHANTDTGRAAFKMIETAFDNYRSILKDTIISEYLDDVETYIDNTKNGLLLKGDRGISKLRKIKYGH